MYLSTVAIDELKIKAPSQQLILISSNNVYLVWCVCTDIIA